MRRRMRLSRPRLSKTHQIAPQHARGRRRRRASRMHMRRKTAHAGGNTIRQLMSSLAFSGIPAHMLQALPSRRRKQYRPNVQQSGTLTSPRSQRALARELRYQVRSWSMRKQRQSAPKPATTRRDSAVHRCVCCLQPAPVEPPSAPHVSRPILFVMRGRRAMLLGTAVAPRAGCVSYSSVPVSCVFCVPLPVALGASTPNATFRPRYHDKPHHGSLRHTCCTES